MTDRPAHLIVSAFRDDVAARGGGDLLTAAAVFLRAHPDWRATYAAEAKTADPETRLAQHLHLTLIAEALDGDEASALRLPGMLLTVIAKDRDLPDPDRTELARLAARLSDVPVPRWILVGPMAWRVALQATLLEDLDFAALLADVHEGRAGHLAFDLALGPRDCSESGG